MPFHPNDLTKKFIEQAKSLINTGKVKRYNDIAEVINWDKTALSNVINGRRNIPQEIYNEFTKVYNVAEIKNPAPSQEQDLKDFLIETLRKQVALLEKQLTLQEYLQEKVGALTQRLDGLADNQLASEALSQAYQEYVIQTFWELQGKRVDGKDTLKLIRQRAYEKLLSLKESGIEIQG